MLTWVQPLHIQQLVYFELLDPQDACPYVPIHSAAASGDSLEFPQPIWVFSQIISPILTLMSAFYLKLRILRLHVNFQGSSSCAVFTDHRGPISHSQE